MTAFAEATALLALSPFRSAIHRFRRGSVPRGLCVLALKRGERAFGHKLPPSLREVRPRDMPELSFEPVDSMVMVAVHWYGVSGYEGRVADLWVALCGQARSVLEIGGNVGLFSVIGGRAAAGTYTVLEPVPAVAAILRRNLARNGVHGVTVREAAAVPGEHESEVILSIPLEQHGVPVGSHLVEGVEVSGRSASQTIAVPGLPARALFAGRDLIKIDAEGIEAELLLSARDILLANRPTLLVEILPEAGRLGALLRDLATQAGYTISIVPEYGSDTVVTVTPAEFDAGLPRQHNSKDVILSMTALPG